MNDVNTELNSLKPNSLVQAILDDSKVSIILVSSYQVSGGGSTDDGGEPEAGAQTDGVAPISYTFASLIIALFLVVFG